MKKILIGLMVITTLGFGTALSDFVKECNEGQMQSCRKAGLIYGSVGEADKALRYYKTACDGDDFLSCKLLAYEYDIKLGKNLGRRQ